MALLEFLANNIWGVLEDNIVMFVYPQFTNPLKEATLFLIGYPNGQHINYLRDNQPLFWIAYYSLSRILNPVVLYNLWVFFTVILNLIFSTIVINKLTKKRTLSFLMAIVFVMSGYMSYHLRSHLDLSQIWLFVVFLGLLLFFEHRYKYIFLGALLALTAAVSNYVAFIVIVFTFSYVLAKQLIYLILLKRNYWTVKVLADVSTLVATFILLTSVILFPYFKANYLYKGSKVPGFSVNRPFEDFIIMSSRPWYYLLPSVDNPFFGEITKKVINWMQQDWGYFLTQNYFKSEHSASYLGWVNMLTAILGIRYIYNSVRRNRDAFSVEFELLTLLLTALIIFTFSMPPYITISGIKLFTPSFLLWKAFPMFRTLSRLSVCIVFITILFSSLGYTLIVKQIRDRFNNTFTYKIIANLVLVSCLMLSMSEFFIPLRITNINNPPKIYSYIKENKDRLAPFVVYPYSKTGSALYWLPYYKLPIINPTGYAGTLGGMTSSELTNILLDCKGIKIASDLGGEYLVFFYKEAGIVAHQKLSILVINGILAETASFTESSGDIFRNRYIHISGNSFKDSATLYKINKQQVDQLCTNLSGPLE